MWKVIAKTIGTIISAIIFVYVFAAAGYVFYAFVLNPMLNY